MFSNIMEDNLKKTALYQCHLASNAKLVDFHGWLMPMEYKGILEEAKTLRKTCGIFDVSHMGQIMVKGKDALNFLQRVLSNDLSIINCGEIQYNLIFNHQGGIIDDLMAYRLEDGFLLVVNASNIETDFGWLVSNQGKFDVEINNESDKFSFIALQGPLTESILRETLKMDLRHIGYMSFGLARFKDRQVLVSRTGYTGEDGFEILIENDLAAVVWETIISKADTFGLIPCGLGSRDILRIEMGYPLYGNDIDFNTNPFEASLSWAVKFKGKDFIGKNSLFPLRNQEPKHKRIGFIMEDKGVPRKDYGIFSQDGLAIGKVTSGTFSPNINKFIGMGYVDSDYLKRNQNIFIDIRSKKCTGSVIKLPFITAKTKRK